MKTQVFADLIMSRLSENISHRASRCGTKPGRFEVSNLLLSHELESVSGASKRVSAAERESKAIRAV